MAAGAGPASSVSSWMAGRAIIIGTTMAGGEPMVKGRPRKRFCVVAVRTLPGIVIGRRGVARGAIR